MNGPRPWSQQHLRWTWSEISTLFVLNGSSPGISARKKKMINRISQQPSTAERFQYGPGRNNPIILSCKRVTNTPKFYCFFHNHYTFLPLKCWDFSEHPGLLTILLEWEHRRKRIPFFLFWWWVNNRKKNQDTNSQFWCFPDLLEALISSTIRNTYIYRGLGYYSSS